MKLGEECFSLQFQQRTILLLVCCRYEGVIAAQFFGHTHFDSWKIFYDVNDGFKRPVSVAYIGPSVTPFSQLNMGYRVYEVDGFYPGSSWVRHEILIAPRVLLVFLQFRLSGHQR
jgi:hypothetical protein